MSGCKEDRKCTTMMLSEMLRTLRLEIFIRCWEDVNYEAFLRMRACNAQGLEALSGCKEDNNGLQMIRHVQPPDRIYAQNFHPC